MNYFEQLAELNRRGMDILEGAVGKDTYEMRACGFSRCESQRLRRLAKVYFGACTSPKKQRDAVAAAKDRGLGLSVLDAIERCVRKFEASRRWSIRLSLCQARSVEKEIARLQLLIDVPPARTTVRTTRNRARVGERTLAVTGPDEAITTMEHAIKKHARKESVSEYDAFMALWNGGGAALELTATVGIWLDEAVEIRRGEHGERCYVRDDGAIMTGAEIAESAFAEAGFAVICHPHEGALDLVRTRRFAGDAQRRVLAFTDPICAHPGCSVPATHARVHHITPWKNGGLTNLDNLTTLCDFHNSLNDDDPLKPLYGRIERVRGRSVWRSPVNGKFVANQSVPAQYAPLRRQRGY